MLKTPPLVTRLSKKLEKRRIKYCQWKGTYSTDQALASQKDIDLLVDCEQSGEFGSVLAELGFKKAQGHQIERLPSSHDFFGYEPCLDRFIHLHVHYKIVIGHPLRGIYRLPLESAYLASLMPQLPFQVPKPEFELVVFILRMVLQGKSLSTARAAEFRHLNARASARTVELILAEQMPFLSDKLFEQCRESVESGDEGQLVKANRMLRRAFEECGLRIESAGKMKVLFHRAIRAIRTRLFAMPPRKRTISNGGKTIALVGGDGAGKSTASVHLDAWLSKHLLTRQFHLGKPPWSLTTRLVRGGLKFAHLLRMAMANRSSDRAELAGVFWSLCAARDKYLAWQQILRNADSGTIVICDRWPLPGALKMDGPKIRKPQANRLTELLARFEERWYQAIGEPDLLVVLRVDPEIAVVRKPGEEGDSVRARGNEVWNAKWDERDALVVDASQPFEKVMTELKGHVWSAI